MSKNREKLFSEFKVPTKQEWLDKIQIDLKGADFNKRLVWRTNEGFSTQPFYRQEDIKDLKTPDALPGEFPYVRSGRKTDNFWYVRQNIVAADAESANAKALDILNRGIDSLGFTIPGDSVSAAFISRLLDGIEGEIAELNFSTCLRRAPELVDILTGYFEKKGYDKTRLVGSIDFDPIGKMLVKGRDLSRLLAQAPLLAQALKDYPSFRALTVNAQLLSDAGAYIVQELGYALAWGHEYLTRLIDAGIDPAEAANKIKFNLGVSGVYFMEIAKFRAARLLWADIVKQYLGETEDLSPCLMCAGAVTSRYNQTLFDSYVNLLRSQTETMSAALGGVHSIVVTPYDAPYEQPNDFSERIARNQQLLLKEESHFDKVVDPGAGSYFIEELTVSLAEEAWKLFLQAEEEGGMLETVNRGGVQDAVNATNDKRHADAAKRKEFILGTNQFPNFTEKSEGKEPIAYGGQTCSEIKTLNFARESSEFETLRLATEKADKVPVAFMLTIGNLVWRQARAQFSANFLATAGWRIIDNLGFGSVEEGVDQAVKAHADCIVLCSSDEEYAQLAPPAYKYLLTKAPDALFVVAGAPACMDELKSAGIDNFIHVRCNVLQTMKEFNRKLGI